MSGNDHTRSEALQWALRHAEAAEAADKSIRQDPRRVSPFTVEEFHREAALATMWAQIAQAMPVD